MGTIFPAPMIVLTRKTDYALVAMAHLAHHPGEEGISSARDIADRYHVPLPVLMNILKTLNREGLVISVRGARGGYRLARPALPYESTMAVLPVSWRVSPSPATREAGLPNRALRTAS